MSRQPPGHLAFPCPKVPYATAGEAKRAMHGLRTRPGAKRHKVKPYRCPHCGQWHCTSKGVR